MKTKTNTATIGRFELRALKIHKGLSQETIAFTADLYFDGKKVAFAECRGHGDQALVRWIGSGAAVQNAAKATEPTPHRLKSFAEYGLPTAYDGVEDIVEEIVGAELARRELDNARRRRARDLAVITFCQAPDGKIYQVRGLGEGPEARLRMYVQGGVILNRLPLEQALAVLVPA